MKWSREASPILEVEVLANRIIITGLLDDQIMCHLELPLDEGSLSLYLTEFGKSDTTHRVLLIQVLRHWELVGQHLEMLGFNKQEYILVTNRLIDWLKSPEFREVWYRTKELRTSDVEFNQDREQIAYDMMRVVAKYSEEAKDIWPFVKQVRSQGVLKKRERFQDVSAEQEVLSTICTKDRRIKPSLLETRQDFDDTIRWFRDRLNLIDAQRLIQARRRWERAKSREVNSLILQARREIKRGSYIQARRKLIRALQLAPGNRKARRCGRKIGLLETKKIERTQDRRDVLFVLKPLLLILIPWLIVAIYSIPRAGEILEELVTSGENIFSVFVRSSAFIHLLFLVLYGLVLSYVLLNSLKSPLIPEPLRSLLLLTFLSSAIPFPLLSDSLWVALLGLSDRQFGLCILVAAIVILAFSYRDIYLVTVRITNNSAEAIKRSMIALLYIAMLASVYALVFSDLAARQLLYNGVESGIEVQSLATDYVLGTVPKLVIISIMPTVSGFSIHLFPSVTLLWCLSSLALGTLEGGILPFLGVFRVRQ